VNAQFDDGRWIRARAGCSSDYGVSVSPMVEEVVRLVVISPSKCNLLRSCYLYANWMVVDSPMENEGLKNASIIECGTGSLLIIE
jgi:hypothetical protein